MAFLWVQRTDFSRAFNCLMVERAWSWERELLFLSFGMTCNQQRCPIPTHSYTAIEHSKRQALSGATCSMSSLSCLGELPNLKTWQEHYWIIFVSGDLTVCSWLAWSEQPVLHVICVGLYQCFEWQAPLSRVWTAKTFAVCGRHVHYWVGTVETIPATFTWWSLGD